MFTASDEIETLPRAAGWEEGGPEFRKPRMFTASAKIEILLRAAEREEGRGHSRIARALRGTADGARTQPFLPSGGSSRSTEREL